MLTSDDGAYWFIGYNHEHVTITKYLDGQHYPEGMLGAGQSGTLANWRTVGFDLKVTVGEVNVEERPHYADVKIEFGPQQEIDDDVQAAPRQESMSPTGAPSKEVSS